MKKYCPIHHYYYSGNVCPLCASEKYSKMMESYKTVEQPKKIKKVDEVTDDMLSKLKDKFNVK